MEVEPLVRKVANMREVSWKGSVCQSNWRRSSLLYGQSHPLCTLHHRLHVGLNTANAICARRSMFALVEMTASLKDCCVVGVSCSE